MSFIFYLPPTVVSPLFFIIPSFCCPTVSDRPNRYTNRAATCVTWDSRRHKRFRASADLSARFKGKSGLLFNGYRRFSPWDEAAGAWSWPISSIVCRDSECLELWPHSLLRLRGVQRDSITLTLIVAEKLFSTIRGYYKCMLLAEQWSSLGRIYCMNLVTLQSAHILLHVLSGERVTRR